jgi:hypothetical protein
MGRKVGSCALFLQGLTAYAIPFAGEIILKGNNYKVKVKPP